MTLYLAPDVEATVGKVPPIDATVAATGPVTQYHGKPEIKIESASQWKW
jgi:DNA/RNA endonuclease YhcR with UshA esterase domain